MAGCDRLHCNDTIGPCEGCPRKRNTAGCCDGSGQVHHGVGALSYVTLCRDAECVARREREWAEECEGR